MDALKLALTSTKDFQRWGNQSTMAEKRLKQLEAKSEYLMQHSNWLKTQRAVV